MTIEEALEYLCRQAESQGADAYDAVAGESESLGLEIFEGRVSNTEISGSRGVGIRIFRNGSPGYSFSEKLSPEALTRAVGDALDHTALTAELKVELPDPQILPEINLELHRPELDEIDFSWMRERGLQMERTARDLDSRVTGVPHLGVGRSSGRTLVRNSRGALYESRSNSLAAYIGVVAAKGDVHKMGIYSNGGREADLAVLQPDFMAGTAVQRAVELLEARPIPGGAYPLILTNRISDRIFAMFSSPYYAELVQKGQSRLAGRLGEKIAASNFNLSCRPHLPGAPGSRLFDGEAVPTRDLEVVTDGSLVSFLYNLEAAAREGRTPSGNAVRSYSGRVSTGFSNMIVERGRSAPDELLSAYPAVIQVTRLEGGAGCSAVSGEISIGIQGFYYENGRPAQPIDRMTMNSNYFEMLPAIEGISSEYSDSFSSVRVPDILVGRMNVSS